MSASKRKGTAAETAVVNWLREHGWPSAERRALAGNADRGDIAGIVGVVLEVKAKKEMDLSGWVKEAETERRNDGADFGIVIAKKRGTTDVGEWYAVMPVEQLAALLDAAGYGNGGVA